MFWMVAFIQVLNLWLAAINLVSKYAHLGHIVSASLDDKHEILSKRNSLCAKINNVLCYFSKRDPLVKLKLLRSYCSDFYGSVLWNLAHSSVEDVLSALHGAKD